MNIKALLLSSGEDNEIVPAKDRQFISIKLKKSLLCLGNECEFDEKETKAKEIFKLSSTLPVL